MKKPPKNKKLKNEEDKEEFITKNEFLRMLNKVILTVKEPKLPKKEKKGTSG